MARRTLNRERILETAVALADEHGLEALSMRRLAQALGVEAMSLYNHVAGKDDLVDAIVDRVIGEVELPDDGDWETAVRRCAHSAREAFLRHRWAAAPAMSPRTALEGARARLRYIEWMLRRLREAGFSAELAYHGYHQLDSHIIGFTYWQLAHSLPAGADVAAQAEAFFGEHGAEFPYLLEHAQQHLQAPEGEGQREFDLGLELILDGLKRMMPG
jgi:AcrR family transcriptional regulator